MRIISLILLVLLVAGCKHAAERSPNSDDFELLTGKDLPQWQYVQTAQDKEHLNYFKHIYDLRKEEMSRPHVGMKVPRVVHFIWLGPNPFPLKSIENVRTWMAKNPGWTFNFWTDIERPAPLPGMQMRRVEEFAFSQLGECFQRSDSFAEKSDVLRYEVLYKEGGVYVDHDVKCFAAFDPLNQAYDFYCGIEMPNTSILPSCVFTTNNLIGIKPHHPILEECMQRVRSEWDRIGQSYPGTDRNATFSRVLHRTFWLFGEAFKAKNNQEGNLDIVLPAYYFDAPNENLALFAHHQYAGSWHGTETAFEKMVRKRLMTLTKKSNLILLALGVSVGLNVAGFVLLCFWMRRRPVTDALQEIPRR